MQGYVHGNNAFKEEYREAPRKKVKTVRKTGRKPAVASKRKTVSNFLCIILITAMAFTVLYRNAVIAEQKSVAVHLQSELEDIESAVVQKQFELERSIDLGQIEAVAVSKLGMKTPDKEQIVYIDLKNEDVVETYKQPVIGNVFGNIATSVSRMLEYLH